LLSSINGNHLGYSFHNIVRRREFVAMNIDLRFGANKGGQQPSEMSYLANRGNALLPHTFDRQIFDEMTHETSENCAKSTRFWSKSRSYRKQMIKPRLPGAGTAIRASDICGSAPLYFVLFESLKTQQIRGQVAAQNVTKYQLRRANSKNLCGTLGICGNSEVA
jgi:hypothetical protein